MSNENERENNILREIKVDSSSNSKNYSYHSKGINKPESQQPISS
jgi:hypothetical protein